MPTPKEVAEILRDEMNNRAMFDPALRAGLAAIVGGESHFQPRFEVGYAHTANARLRAIFHARLGAMEDSELNRLKFSDERFFNFIYGPQFEHIHHLGNTATGDGYRFRGGGLNQLTGRANYAYYSTKVGVDLIAHPELINTPRVAAAVAVEYMRERFHAPGDFDAMKRAVGVSIGAPDAEKNKLFAAYRQSGEWNFKPVPVAETAVKDDTAVPVVYNPAVSDFIVSLHRLQSFLRTQKLYTGPTDDDPGPGTRAALAAYIKTMKAPTGSD